MIADAELKVAKLYEMLPAEATPGKRSPAENATVRTVFLIGPDKEIKLMLFYPMTTGRNFDEVLRALDSIQLTAKHKVATPAKLEAGPGRDHCRLGERRGSEGEISRRMEGAETPPADRQPAVLA
jgi:alkyl hydroperoxide reductase subunit AhpC